jgi:hypothetical protein
MMSEWQVVALLKERRGERIYELLASPQAIEDQRRAQRDIVLYGQTSLSYRLENYAVRPFRPKLP